LPGARFIADAGFCLAELRFPASSIFHPPRNRRATVPGLPETGRVSRLMTGFSCPASGEIIRIKHLLTLINYNFIFGIINKISD